MIYLQAIILIDDPIISIVETIQQNNEHTVGLIITFCWLLDTYLHTIINLSDQLKSWMKMLYCLRIVYI